MSRDEKDNIEEQELVEEMQDEIQEIEDEEGNIDEEKLQEAQAQPNSEIERLKDQLSRTQADYQNYQNRVARDKDDMIFFLKSDILKKILPRIDDLQRMIQNTPEEMRTGALYEGIVSMESKLIADLEKMWVVAFNSKWETVDPNKHDVMTTVPGQEEWIIVDEFEKWYILWEKVLRHAKVVVGAGV